jgi:uncharacterized protein (TIGR00369 family)
MDEALFGGFPRPPCAELLGLTLLDYNSDERWARFAFQGRREFLNPAGFIQGGILAAMLDDTMGPTVLLASRGTLFTATINLNISFLKPAKPGRLLTEGRVVSMGKTIAFVEATLSDEQGLLLATGTASARLVPVDKLPPANPAAAQT